MDFKQKNVLITGASSGIGYACAVQVAKLGGDLILIARRKDRIVELAKHDSNKNLRFLLSLTFALITKDLLQVLIRFKRVILMIGSG